MCISSLVKYALTLYNFMVQSWHVKSICALKIIPSSTHIPQLINSTPPALFPAIRFLEAKHTKADNLAVHGQKIKHPQLDVVTMKQMKRRDSLICLKIFLRFQSGARNILRWYGLAKLAVDKGNAWRLLNQLGGKFGTQFLN